MTAGLVLAEVKRLLSRRFFRMLAAGAFGVIVVVAVVTFINASNDPHGHLNEARAVVAECRSHQVDPSVPPGVKRFECPSVEQVEADLSDAFDYADSMPTATRAVSIALMSLCFVIGASFVGAEWGTGSMTTTLTWEPRRGRLLAAKAIACAAVVAVFAVAVLAVVTLIFLPVASLRGTTAGVDGDLWRTLTGNWLRGAGIATFGSLVGCGLATLFRNTAGAVGSGFFYMAIVDPLLGTLWQARFRIWTIQHLVPRFLGLPVEVPQPQQVEGAGVIVQMERHLSMARPIVLLSVYAAALLALAYGAFRARDVT